VRRPPPPGWRKTDTALPAGRRPNEMELGFHLVLGWWKSSFTGLHDLWRGRPMTAETIRDLLEPLTGRSGSIYLIVSRTGPIGFATAENKKLTGVEIRPDGLIRLERESGWAILDPTEVMAVVWNGDPESTPGQFL
jgi:hypothetical protein